MSDNKFINGLIVKAPNERAPEYVKARISIRREELIAWLQTEQGEWINADIKVSQGGRWYAAVDDWKPDGSNQPRRNATNYEKTVPAEDFKDDPFPF